ncbi:ABC transporter substrate-binding protein [Bosea sp. 2RAB26]|uniref:ABC transporter substrate-binding protein n=1 Tax=Bosea sp. 2RAB26 TaxID=3237476 RepID=UPI003F8FBF8B
MALPAYRSLIALAPTALLSLSPMPALAQTAASGAPIRIGAVISATGAIAGVGLPEREGILLAQKTLNARGGVNGQPIEILIEDDASSPDVAVSKVNALVHSHKIKALIGTSGIAQTVAVGGITAPLKLTQIAFSGLGPAVERDRTCVFHITPSQELNARALLSYVRDMKASKVGVLHDSGYGQVVWNSMKDLAGEFGVTWSQVEKFEIAATDLTTQAAKVRASAPDAVIVISTSPMPFRNARQVRLTAPIISVHGTATYDYVKAMGDAADNIIHAEFLIAEDPLPHQREFVDLFQKEHGRLPKHFEAAGWDAVMSLAQALKTAGPDATNEALCSAMRRPYQGVMAKFDFSAPDMGGLTLASFNYSKLVKGKFTRLDYSAAK